MFRQEACLRREDRATCRRRAQVLARVGVLCENEEYCAPCANGTPKSISRPAGPLPAQAGRNVRPSSYAARMPAAAGVGHALSALSPGIALRSPRSRTTSRRRAAQRCTRDFITFTQLAQSSTPKPVSRSLSSPMFPPMEPLEAGCCWPSGHPSPSPLSGARTADYLTRWAGFGIDHWYLGATCFAHPLASTAIPRASSSALRRVPLPGSPPCRSLVRDRSPSRACRRLKRRADRHLDCRARPQPHRALSGSIWAATIDMKSGSVSYSPAPWLCLCHRRVHPPLV